MTKIWCANSDYLPHVIVNGEVVVQVKDQQFVTSEMRVSVPITDYKLVLDVERLSCVVKVNHVEDYILPVQTHSD